MRRPLLAFPLFFALAVTACAGGSGDRADVTEADSAGVRILTNHALPETLPGWTLAEPPLLDIGVVEGEEAYQLFRVTDAARLEDGRVVVLNGGTGEVRFFSGSGRFLEAVGGTGEGPGEYRYPFRVFHLPGDSLLIFDLTDTRFTVLDAAARVGRTFRQERPTLNAPEFAGLLGDSTIVTHEAMLAIPAAGFDTMYARAAFMDLEGRGRDSLMVPTFRMGVLDAVGGMIGRPHFEPETVFTTNAEGLWMATARTAELRLYRPDRTLGRIVRWPWTPRPVTEADVAALVEGRLAGTAPERQPRLRTMLEGTPAAENFPALLELHTDAEDRLWVLELSVPGEGGPGRWLVFDPQGRLVARASLPLDLQVLEIGEDYLLAAVTDNLDVEHVRMWRIER